MVDLLVVISNETRVPFRTEILDDFALNNACMLLVQKSFKAFFFYICTFHVEMLYSKHQIMITIIVLMLSLIYQPKSTDMAYSNVIV